MIDWSIAQNALAQPDAGQRFQMGFQMAQDRRRQQQEDEFRTQQREAQARRQQEGDALAQMERRREDIIKGARIVRELNPKDEAGWQQARAIAAQMGIPLEEVPPTFDPAYVQNLVKMADAFAPQSGGAGFTLGENQVRYDANGRKIASGPAARPRYYPIPQGGRLELDPAYGGGVAQAPQPGAIDVDEDTGQQYRFKGGNHADPANWEEVGGPGASPGTFP